MGRAPATPASVPSHDGDPPHPRAAREAAAAAPDQAKVALSPAQGEKQQRQGQGGVRRGAVRRPGGPTPNHPAAHAAPAPSAAPAHPPVMMRIRRTVAPAQQVQPPRRKASLPNTKVTPCKILVPPAMQEFLNSQTDLVASPASSTATPSAAPTPRRSLSHVDSPKSSFLQVPADASPGTIGSALRRVSLPGQPLQAKRQLELLLTRRETREAGVAARAGSGEDGYDPLDSPELLLPLPASPRTSSYRPATYPKRLSNPRPVRMAVKATSVPRAGSPRPASCTLAAPSRSETRVADTGLGASVPSASQPQLTEVPANATSTTTTARSRTPPSPPSMSRSRPLTPACRAEADNVTPTMDVATWTSPARASVAVQTDADLVGRGVRDAAQDTGQDGTHRNPAPADPDESLANAEQSVESGGTSGVLLTSTDAADPMLDPMLDSDSLGSLVSPARGPPTLFEGDWLGRDSSSLDALPPPGGSRGEGPGSLGLSLKGAAGEAGASVILAPSYRNERTISTFGLASLSALDGGASATSAAVHDQLSAPTTPEQPDTAHSAGVLVRRAPELASLPVLKASSAPAATTSTPTEVADTTAKAAGPYFEAAADWCALADSDTWESDEEAPDVETAAEDLEERDSFPGGHADEALVEVEPLTPRCQRPHIYDTRAGLWPCMKVAVGVAVPLKRTLNRYTLSSAEAGAEAAWLTAAAAPRNTALASWTHPGDAIADTGSPNGSDPSLSSAQAEAGSVGADWDSDQDEEAAAAELGDAGEARGDASLPAGSAAASSSEELARLELLARLAAGLGAEADAEDTPDSSAARQRRRPRARSRSRSRRRHNTPASVRGPPPRPPRSRLPWAGLLAGVAALSSAAALWMDISTLDLFGL